MSDKVAFGKARRVKSVLWTEEICPRQMKSLARRSPNLKFGLGIRVRERRELLKMHIGIPKRMFEPAPSCGEVYAMPPYRARGYFADAWHRFLGLATVRIALSVLSLICLFSVLAPLFISRSVSHMDPYYAKLPPRISALSGRAGIADGSVSRRLGDEALIRLYAIGIGAGDARYSPVISVGEGEGRVRHVKLDAYLEVGFVYKDVTEERYLDMREWEREEGLQLLYPMIDNGEHATASGDANL